jgi:hypothetical protein
MRGMSGDTSFEERLKRAEERFLSVYGAVGGHRWYGWDDYSDPRNYKGPVFWSEADCAYQFALTLEQEFPQ